MKQQNHKPKKKALKAEKTKRAKRSNKSKRRYHLRNWSEYNEALKQRGSLDVWIDEGIQEKWYAEPTGKIGAQPVYSDLAITSTLQIGIVFHQRLRQTEGFMKSLFQHILIPPGKNARIWQHGKSRAKPHPRDENLRDIRSTSRNRWKESVKYHIRSLVESAIFRFKGIFGDKLHARKLGQQKTEAGIKVAILNLMMRLGMPQSYAVA